MGKKKTIWFDFTNVPHVNFLNVIIKHFGDKYDYIHSLRDFAETKGLFYQRIGTDVKVIGTHKGQNKFRKVLGSFIRVLQLYKNIDGFDVKISVGGDSSSIVAKLKGKLSITFDDNEKAPNWRYSKFSDAAFWPSVIDRKILLKQGFSEKAIHQYDGFKEDFYIADYVPDEAFPQKIPFKDYVVVRPENIQANYVEGNASIVIPLLKSLCSEKINVVFLPRYKSDINYCSQFKEIFIPEKPLNGLDLVYFSKAVFTGAGTMAREAACMGIPSFSFYAGKELLTVDKEMIKKDLLFFSRDAKELVDAYKKAKKGKADIHKSKEVKKQIIDQLQDLLK